MRDMKKCAPRTNPHYWVMIGPVMIREKRKGKWRDIRYQKARCNKCGEERFFLDWFLKDEDQDGLVL